jgi:acyl-CoA reductase-like NAD-dependent aldehyde dehydrogenase
MQTDKLIFTNPATGEKFGEMPMTSPETVALYRQEMGRAAAVWRQKTLAERVRILKQFQGVLIEAVDEISAVLNQDCGKTRQDGLIELFITVDLLHQYCSHAPRWLRRKSIWPGLYFFRRYYTEQRPYGTVAVIGPWNYPLIMVLGPALAALAAGNTVVLKPSEVTAATGQLIEKLLQRVPDLAPFVRVVHGDGRVGEALVRSKPDLVFLTGSTPTGKRVSQVAAENLTPVIFELGGKDAMIVLEDADLDAAARWGVWGAFFNAGQTCMAVERVYVVESVYDAFVERVLHYTREFKMGYTPAVESPYSLGPLTFQRQVTIMEQHLQDALAKGARILVGGQRREMFAEPTVMVNVNHDMLLMREETFSPVMPIMKVKNEAEAVRLANDNQYGLGAYIWTSDIQRGQRVGQQIEAGTIVINDALSHFAVTQLPFGGVKQSGNGRVHGEPDLLQFTQTQAYSVGRPPLPFDIATLLRQPGYYWLGDAILKLVFGVTPRQRLEPLRQLLPPELPTVLPTTRRTASNLATAGTLMALATLLLSIWRWRK